MPMTSDLDRPAARAKRLARFALGLVVLAGAGVLILMPLVVPAQAQTNQAQTTPAPRPDPAYEAAKAAFDPLPEADRKAIQEALIWTGDFAGAGAGGFGPMTYKAITAFQKRQKANPDGILQPKERADLEAAAARARQAVKFTKVVDARSGVRIGVPQRLLDRTQVLPGGVRHLSGDGLLMLDTITLPGGEADLPALFDRYKAEAPGRRTTYKVLRPDWFVVATEGEGRKSYTRVSSGPGGLRGFTFAYPVTAGMDLDRLVIAIANSFEPFPAPAAATAGGAAPAGGAPPAAQVQPAATAPALVATGMVVAPGRVLTTASVTGCTTLSVNRQSATLATANQESGLALLDAPGVRGSAPTLATAQPIDGAALVVLAFSANRNPTLLVAAAEGRVPAGGQALRVFAPLQRGAAGSVVTDRTGAVVGIVAGKAPEPRMVAGVVPQASWPTVPASFLESFLKSAGIATATGQPRQTQSVGDIATALKGALVPVECSKSP